MGGYEPLSKYTTGNVKNEYEGDMSVGVTSSDNNLFTELYDNVSSGLGSIKNTIWPTTEYKPLPIIQEGASPEEISRGLANAQITTFNNLNKPGLLGLTRSDWGNFGQLTSGLASLANIYSGFKQLDLMKDQLGIAKDQWATTKEELARVRKVRDRLNKQY